MPKMIKVTTIEFNPTEFPIKITPLIDMYINPNFLMALAVHNGEGDKFYSIILQDGVERYIKPNVELLEIYNA